MAKYKIVQRVKTSTDYDYLFPYSPWQIHECVEQETSTPSSIVISTGLNSTIVPNTFVAMYYSSNTNTANATITVDSKAAIPIKNGTDNIEAGIIGSGMYILMLIDYSNDIASVLFSAASIQDIKNEINYLTTQITNILNGTLAVGNSNKLNGLISSNFTKSFENITSGSIFDWADTQNQSILFMVNGSAVEGVPLPAYFNGILIHASASTKLCVLFRRANNNITSQIFIAIKNLSVWTSFFEITSKYSHGLISSNGSKTVSLADDGSINFGGRVFANGFSQNPSAYGQPMEIGQFLDMHKAGSTSDHDARIYINPSNNRVFLANPNDTNTQGYFVTNPDNNIFQIKKLTQSQYDSLQTKVSSTIYLITG